MEISPIKYEELKHIKNIESGGDKEFHLENKKIEIYKIQKEQKELILKIKRVNNLPENERYKIILNRGLKIIKYTLELRGLEFRKRIIMSQPIPKFKSGGVEVGNCNLKEIILKR